MEDIGTYKKFVKILYNNPESYNDFKSDHRQDKLRKLNMLDCAIFTFKKRITDLEIRYTTLKNRLKIAGIDITKSLKPKLSEVACQTKVTQYKQLKKEICELKEKIKKLSMKTNQMGIKSSEKARKDGKNCIYVLNEELKNDEEIMNLFKLVQLLQKQYYDSKEELELLQKAVQRRENESDFNEKTYLIESQIAELDYKNDNVRVLISDVQNENTSIINQINDTSEILQNLSKKKFDMLEKLSLLPKDDENTIAEEIKTCEKRIKILEENIKDISNNPIFDTKLRSEFSEQLENLEHKATESKAEYKTLQHVVSSSKSKLYYVKQRIEEKNKQKTQNELKLTSLKAKIENKIQDTYSFQGKDGSICINKNDDNPEHEKKEVPDSKDRKLYLNEITGELSQNELEILGLKKDDQNEGWFFVSDRAIENYIAKPEKDNLILDEKKKKRLNLLQEVQKLQEMIKMKKLEKESKKLEVKNDSKYRKIEKQPKPLKQEKHPANNNKAIEASPSLNKAILPFNTSYQPSLQDMETDSEVYNDGKNRFEIYLGNFELYDQKLQRNNSIIKKYCVSITFYNLEPAITHAIDTKVSCYDQIMSFEFDYDSRFINYCEEETVVVEIFSIDTNDMIQKIGHINLELKEFLYKSHQKSDYCYRNRYEFEHEKLNIVGFIDIAYKFKYNMSDCTLIDEANNKISKTKCEENLQDKIEMNIPRPQYMYDINDNESHMDARGLAKVKNTSNPVLLLFIHKLYVEKQDLNKLYFVYYDFDGDYSTETVGKSKDFVFNYKCQHELDEENYRSRNILLYIFEDNLDQCLDYNNVDIDNEHIGTVEIKIEDVLNREDDSFKLMEVCKANTKNSSKFNLEIQVFIKPKFA